MISSSFTWRFFQRALMATVLLPSFALAGQDIKTPAAVTQLDEYALNMLELALSYEIDGVKGGELKAVGSPNHTQSRLIDEVQSGNLDVMWAASDAALEARLLPVRIPLLKGLLGHRILLIHKDNQARFDGIETFADLKKISFGLGATWADTKILQGAGLNVVTANKYESLLHMVDGGRFDAFPRGLQEPWSEISGNPSLELGVETGLMLVYKMPFYVFVASDNQALAARLEAGFNRAIAEGEFDKRFFQDANTREALERVNLSERRVFTIENNQLPAQTPVDRAELWLNLDEVPAKLAYYAQTDAAPIATELVKDDAPVTPIPDALSVESAAASSADSGDNEGELTPTRDND